MRIAKSQLIGLVASLVFALAFGFSGCGRGEEQVPESPAASANAKPVKLRLGYFPNLTHATAIVGVEEKIFEKALAPDELSISTFNAGPAAVEALFSGALDAAYVGPNPAINAFVKSKGDAIRIISGATSGGAALVVKPSIGSASALKGKKLASPQLGGTQDVALRAWLAENNLKADVQGGGDVSISPQENSQTLETFKQGLIDGAWVPEPWATRLVQEGGGSVLVDESELWPDGKFVTTHLIVRTEFLRDHPATVKRLLEGQVDANKFVHEDAAKAQQVVNAGIERLTGKPLADGVVSAAWDNLTFTNDPIASSLTTAAKNAKSVGLLDDISLDGIYDLKLLNEVLVARGEAKVSSASGKA